MLCTGCQEEATEDEEEEEEEEEVEGGGDEEEDELEGDLEVGSQGNPTLSHCAIVSFPDHASHAP